MQIDRTPTQGAGYSAWRSVVRFLKVSGPALLLGGAALLVAYQFVDPAPPKTIRIASGAPEGAYSAYAQRYRQFFERQGVALDIHHTDGSVENLRLLNESIVDAGFVQGGTESAGGGELYSLGSLYFEPVWLFYRTDQQIRRLTDLRGKRLAVGGAHSGTRALALALLELNKLDDSSLTLVELGGRDAARALESGELDAALFVSGGRSPLIKELISMPGIELMDFRRAAAYARVLPYLSRVVLAEGMIDLVRNLPATDIHLLAPTAKLAVRQDMHPALQDLLMQALDEAHSDGGWFEDTGQFPTAEFLVLPLSPEAERFYKHGPPFLLRYLPFWAATLVDRLKVMLVPLVVVLLPLLRFMPPLYTWRMRAKIYRWYEALEKLESESANAFDPKQFRAHLDELERIEAEVRKVDVPLSFSAQAYDLRQHLRLVHDALLNRVQSPQGEDQHLRPHRLDD